MRRVVDRRTSSAQRGYGHKWQKARDSFLRANPLCVLCSTPSRPVAATVVDHKTPPKLAEAKAAGDPVQLRAAQALFWDRDNWQPLCKHCHDSVKQRLEKSGRVQGCDASGRPLDRNHHWFKG